MLTCMVNVKHADLSLDSYSTKMQLLALLSTMDEELKSGLKFDWAYIQIDGKWEI